jgi:hypothetical protein
MYKYGFTLSSHFRRRFSGEIRDNALISWKTGFLPINKKIILRIDKN